MPIWKHTLMQEDDLRIIESVVSPIIGERWWKAIFSYGDELRLQIGKKVLTKSTLFLDRERGSWQLDLTLASWNYTVNNELVVSSADIVPNTDNKYLKEYFHSLFLSSELIITDFTVIWPDLSLMIKFNNGSAFAAISPSDENDISSWELFTPFVTVLKVGPQNTIGYYNSNEVNA